MPLNARHVDEHYPDRNPSEHADDFVVLSGSLEAGSFHRIANGPLPPYDREIDRSGLGPMIRNELRIVVRPANWSLDCSPIRHTDRSSWSLILAGVSRPHDEDFVWHGLVSTERKRSTRLRGVVVTVARLGRARTGRAVATREKRG